VCLFSFDGRRSVPDDVTSSRVPNVDVNEANELEGAETDGGYCHTGSGLVLQAFPQRRESFLYRHPLDGSGDLIPKSLTRNLLTANEPPSVYRKSY